MKQLGTTIMKHNPELKALLDSYDITRADPSYSHYKYAHVAPELRELLEAPDLVLTRQYRISERVLSSKLGIPPPAIRRTPDLLALVKDKQAEIDRRYREGDTRKTFKLWGVEHLNRGATPYSETHRRVFDFSHLSDLYGLVFAEYIGTAFVAVAASKTGADQYRHRITHFLKWLADDELGATIAKAVRHGGAIDTMQFEECAHRYHREVYFAFVGLADKKPGARGSHPNLQVIEMLSEAGVFPRVHFPRMSHRAFAWMKAAAKPSLAEARIEPGAQDVLRLAEAAASGDAPVDLGDDAVRFAETVNLERQRRPDLPASLPAAIRVICEERLLALRRAASAVFEEWRKDYEWARGEITRAPHSGADAFRMLEVVWSSGNTSQGRATVARLFPRRDTTTALRQLLALIDANFGGICPRNDSHPRSRFWEHAYRKVGGSPKVQALLAPTRQACSAVAVLYLCETGANVSTALSLSPDSIQPSRISGHLSVVGTKARSGGKPIYDLLSVRPTAPDCTSAAAAIQCLAAATDAARRAAPQHANALFLHVRRGRVIALNAQQI